MNSASAETKTSALDILEAQILLRLAQSTATGNQLRSQLSAEDDAFDRAATQLWRDFALRGLKSDGCCNDPCGLHCVSALKEESQWSLTDRGHALLQKMRQATLTG